MNFTIELIRMNEPLFLNLRERLIDPTEIAEVRRIMAAHRYLAAGQADCGGEMVRCLSEIGTNSQCDLEEGHAGDHEASGSDPTPWYYRWRDGVGVVEGGSLPTS